jgi:threonine dehydrogenase-like Zn-dependent dehydrogenase
MKALVVTGPHRAEIQEAPAPRPEPGEVVVQVRRAGICGTDREIWTGGMSYLQSGHAAYPMRIGHEWMGTVAAVGADVDPAWLGDRVTGDTMLGCGRCRRCRRGHQHVCEDRSEIGVRGGRPGALAEQIAVEPGGNAYRCVQAAEVTEGDRCLITGPGTIGLLCAMFARAAGAEVHLLGVTASSLEFTRDLGFEHVWTEDRLPELPWDAVIDASDAPQLPSRAADLVEPGGRVVYIGLAESPSLIDTRTLVLKDVTAVGVLSASPGLAGTVDAFARGEVDPRPVVAATVRLEELPAVLAGERPSGAGPGPKIHVAMTEAE